MNVAYAQDSSEDEESQVLIDNQNEADIDAGNKLYEDALDACNFSSFHVLVLIVSGWALSSDSVEMQVVSFVLPSACDLKMTSNDKGWLNATLFIGMMIGGFLFGGSADVKGRRYVMMWSMSVNGLFGLLSAFAPSFRWFLLLRLVSGIGAGAAMPTIFTYVAEFFKINQRGPAIAFTAIFWSFGNIFTSLFAWLIIPRTELSASLGFITFSSWRIFVMVGALPSLSSAIFMFFMPESPMYLNKIGKRVEASDIFIRMFKAKYGKDQPLSEKIKCFAEYAQLHNAVKKKSIDMELCAFGRGVVDLMTTLEEVSISAAMLFSKQHVISMVLLIIIWFSLSFGFYGMFLWLPEIFKRVESGGGSACTKVKAVAYNVTCEESIAQYTDLYVQSFSIALSTIPGTLFTVALVNTVGRRLLMAISMILGGISVLFIPLVRTRVTMVALLCIFSGMCTGGWDVLNMLTVENFPTELRTTAYGVQSGFGRIAAICSNVAFGGLVDQHCAIPIMLVTVFLGIGGLTALKLPKTDDSPLL